MSDIASRLPTTDFADGAVGSAVPSEAIASAGKNTSGNLQIISIDAQGGVVVGGEGTAGTPTGGVVSVQGVSGGTNLNTQTPIQTNTGTLTSLSSVITVPLQSVGSVNIDVSGSGFVGSITVLEMTPSSARQLGFFNLNSSSVASTITANGNYRIVGVPVAPSLSIQFSSYTSGSATIYVYSSAAPYIFQPFSQNAANLFVTSYLNDGSGNAITSTTINSKQRLDVNLASEGTDGSTAPFNTIQTGGQDTTGKLQAFITLPSGEQFVRDVINVSGQNRAQSVTTTAAEALGGSTILTNRKFLSITPTNGIIYWGFTSGVTTTTGSPIFTNQNFTIAATDNVHVYVIAAATTDARISEGS